MKALELALRELMRLLTPAPKPARSSCNSSTCIELRQMRHEAGVTRGAEVLRISAYSIIEGCLTSGRRSGACVQLTALPTCESVTSASGRLPAPAAPAKPIRAASSAATAPSADCLSTTSLLTVSKSDSLVQQAATVAEAASGSCFGIGNGRVGKQGRSKDVGRVGRVQQHACAALLLMKCRLSQLVASPRQLPPCLGRHCAACCCFAGLHRQHFAGNVPDRRWS